MSKLPVQTKVRPAVYPPGWYMAKSGLGIHTQKHGPKLVFGFAFGASSEEASARSQYEVYERTYAHYDLFVTKQPELAAIPVLHWQNHQKIGERQLEDLLFAHPLKQRGWVDANGLAWHSELGSAINGGLWETIERHQLSRWWYLGDLALVPLWQASEDNFTIEAYTSDDVVPMAVVIIRDCSGDFLVCGSACAENLDAAVSKASREAYMMLDGVLAFDQGPANHPASRTKLLSLRGPTLTNLRYNFILRSVSDVKGAPAKEVGIMPTLQHLGFDSALVGYSLLHQAEREYLIRAFIPGARNPKEFGGIDGIPPDPFC